MKSFGDNILENNNRKWVIIFYNLYTAFFFPALFFLMGVWALEVENEFSYKRINAVVMGVAGVFLPEVLLGLQKNINKVITITCSIVWFWILLQFEHYFIFVRTNAFVTYYCVLIILLIGVVWTVVMEFNQDLREHILMFPQNQWLVPCSKNYKAKRIWSTIWIVSLIIGFIFFVTIERGWIK